MKKSFIATAIMAIGLFFAGGALAQSQATSSAGLTPDSPFYFLDKISEAIQRFFTFNPESKVRLEISFAKERAAEIKIILENKGVSDKGLSVAENDLKDNLSRAADVLKKEKEAGKDTGDLAKKLSGEINSTQDALKDAFKSGKNALEAKEDELKAKIKEARRIGDAAQVEALTKQLADIKAQKELLDENENDNEKEVDEESDRVDEALGLKNEVAKKIREAEKDKIEIINEAKDENVVLPAETFNVFDGFLSQAKTAFNGGNYEEAKRLIIEAKKSLKDAEKKLENVKDAKENNNELKQGSENND